MVTSESGTLMKVSSDCDSCHIIIHIIYIIYRLKGLFAAY